MEIQYTPGPWRVEKSCILHGPVIPDPRGHGTISGIIAQVMGTALKQHRANALLIAAAPELLEILKLAAKALQLTEDELYLHADILKKIYTVIDKAEKAKIDTPQRANSED